MKLEVSLLALSGGGLLIGLSASLLLLFNGRIAGITGICSQILSQGPGKYWRLAFLAGMLLGGLLLAFLTGSGINIDMQGQWPVWLVGGFLVGYGTRMGNGCTSGHGICGLSRLSLRSLVAVLTFMATGMITATMMTILGIF